MKKGFFINIIVYFVFSFSLFFLNFGVNAYNQDLQKYLPDTVLKVTEGQVLIKADTLQVYSLSNDGVISQDEIKESLLNPNPAEQPTFIDIVYMQYKVITNLFLSLKNLETVQFDSYFDSTQDREYYLNLLDTMNKYSNKDDFINALSGGVSIKDIGTLNDIIYGLSSRAKCYISGQSNCQNMKISISKKDRYSFYDMNEINNQIFNSSNNAIGDNFLGIYGGISTLSTFGSTYSGPEKEFLVSFLGKIFANDLNNLSGIDDYDIGYGLNIRISNLNALKQGFLNKTNDERITLLGVHNFYNEVNNLVKGLRKTVELKKAINDNDLSSFISKIIDIDLYDQSSVKSDAYIPMPDDFLNKILNVELQTSFSSSISNRIYSNNCGSTELCVFLRGESYPLNDESGKPIVKIESYDKAKNYRLNLSEDLIINKTYQEINRVDANPVIKKNEVPNGEIKISFINPVSTGKRRLYLSHVMYKGQIILPENSEFVSNNNYSTYETTIINDKSVLTGYGYWKFSLTDPISNGSNYSSPSTYVSSSSVSALEGYVESEATTNYLYLIRRILPTAFQGKAFIKGEFKETSIVYNLSLKYPQIMPNCLLYGREFTKVYENGQVNRYFDLHALAVKYPFYCGLLFK